MGTEDMGCQAVDTKSKNENKGNSCFPCPHFLIFVSVAWQPISFVSMIKLQLTSPNDSLTLHQKAMVGNKATDNLKKKRRYCNKMCGQECASTLKTSFSLQQLPVPVVTI